MCITHTQPVRYYLAVTIDSIHLEIRTVEERTRRSRRWRSVSAFTSMLALNTDPRTKGAWVIYEEATSMLDMNQTEATVLLSDFVDLWYV